jgi:hypothetical protein
MTAFSKRYTKLQNFSLLEAIAESGCVVEGVKVLCAKLFYVVLPKWWKQGRYEIFWIMSTNKCLECHLI